MNLSLLVIRTEKIQELKDQYSLLGFNFEYHKHRNGPYHFASEIDGFVFEIYPLTKSMTQADGNLRLGFKLDNLQETMNQIINSNWVIKSNLKETEWGHQAIVQDLDGRKVELYMK